MHFIFREPGGDDILLKVEALLQFVYVADCFVVKANSSVVLYIK